MQFAQAVAPGAWLVDIIPSCKSPKKFSSNFWRTYTISTISPRLGPWHGIQKDCRGVEKDSNDFGQYAF